MKSLAIIGSRDFTNLSYAASVAKPYIEIHDIEEIVSGGAAGADRLAEEIAEIYGLRIRVFKANWKKYGKAAGMIRNGDIIDNCDCALVFWNGESKGTLNSINRLAKARKMFLVVNTLNGDWDWYNVRNT